MKYLISYFGSWNHGGVAQMVERSLSMREVPGSIPGISRFLLQIIRNIIFRICKNWQQHHCSLFKLQIANDQFISISMLFFKMMQEFKTVVWSHYFIEMLYRIEKKGRGLTALSWIINHESLYDSFISKMVIIPSTYEAISLWDVENSGNIALSDSTPRQTITKNQNYFQRIDFQ